MRPNPEPDASTLSRTTTPAAGPSPAEVSDATANSATRERVARTTRPLPAEPPFVRFWHEHLDVILIVALTLLAAALRLWQLGAIPQGIHGDEAQVGMDARRVLADGWIGPYTPAALGQPSGHAYLTAPFIELFGSTDWSVRLPLALTGIAAIPLCYILFRLHTTRAMATMTAFLLATSLWHIHYSRTAHWPISYPTVALGVLVLWTLAIQRGQWYWFVAAGALLGLGLYTYNVYPIFVVAFTAWVLVYTIVYKRREIVPWVSNVSLAVAAAVVVALPLFLYIAENREEYFQHYRGYYEQYSILESKAYKEADSGEKLDLIVDKTQLFLRAYATKGITDFVDGASPDRKPMLDQLTVALGIVGVGLAIWRWWDTPNLLSVMMAGIIPLTTVLQTNAIYRGPLGAAPFVCFLAALPLGMAWRHARRLRFNQRKLVYGGVGLVLAVIAYTNVHVYFADWAKHPTFAWVYAQQITEASKYAEAQPDDPYVYFAAGRWTINYETRQYLAPDLKGEDRSKEFGKVKDFGNIDRGRDSLILLLPPYTDQIKVVEALYPGGREHTETYRGETLFIAYHVPRLSAVSESP